MKSRAKKKTGKVVTGVLLALFMILLIFRFTGYSSRPSSQSRSFMARSLPIGRITLRFLRIKTCLNRSILFAI